MINHRTHFFSVMEGGKPRNMPFFPDITDWYVANRTPHGQDRPYGPGDFIPDDVPFHKQRGTIPEKYKDWTLFDFYRNFDWGFHVHISDWFRIRFSGGVERRTWIDGRKQYIQLVTPKGSLTRVDLHSSEGLWARSEFFVKSVKDLDIMQYVVEHTHYVPAFENVLELRRQMGDWGQGDLAIFRSPFGKLVQEYMGFENVIYAMTDDLDAMVRFMAVLEVKDLELIEIATRAPERVVIISDHADENLIAPPYWRDYCCPFYRKACDILHKSGKFVSTHLDGNFKGFFPFLAQSGFDLLDGCTPAPMFNYEVEELAAAMPAGMKAFCGVPSTMFCRKMPTVQLLDMADRIMESLQGRGIINVGDILPPDGDIEQVVALGEHVRRHWVS